MIEAADIRTTERAANGERKGYSLHSLVLQPFYDHAGITIFCGDNRQILPMLKDEYDLLLTDPPYGIGYAAHPIQVEKGNHTPQDWDSAPADEWVMALARSLCRKQIIWGGNYYSLPPSRCWLSWHKPDAVPSMSNVEYAWTSMTQNSKQISHSIAATNGERVGHPTQKPLRVMGWALQQAGQSKTLLDPWMGSGTSLVAAKLAGLRAIGIEANESYCKLAVSRLAQGVLGLENGALCEGAKGNDEKH